MLSDVFSHNSECKLLAEGSEKRGQGTEEHVESPVVALDFTLILVIASKKHEGEEDLGHEDTEHWEDATLDARHADTQDDINDWFVVRSESLEEALLNDVFLEVL